MAKPGRKKKPRSGIKLRRTLNNQEFLTLKNHLKLTWEEYAQLLGISVRYCQKLGCVSGKCAKPISRKVNNSAMYLLSMNPVIFGKEPELPK